VYQARPHSVRGFLPLGCEAAHYSCSLLPGAPLLTTSGFSPHLALRQVRSLLRGPEGGGYYSELGASMKWT
jgi:hypothetical protein